MDKFGSGSGTNNILANAVFSLQRQTWHIWVVLQRENLFIHLQWHNNTKEDPLLGGSVIKIFVDHIDPIVEEFVERKTITKEKLLQNTNWNTNEFGFFDLNNNAIFFVQSL